MKISSFTEFADVAGWQFTPRTRYLLTESIWHKIANGLVEHGNPNPVHSWSSSNSYERRYGGQDLNGRRVMLYRENAFGDALVVTALAHWIKTEYPQANIEVYSVPAMNDAWRHNTDVQFIGAPPTFDAMKSCDYHVLLEGMMENDAEPEQSNCYDNLFSFCGISPFHVPAEMKRPHIVWGPSDDQCMKQWKEWKPWRYVLCHVCPSSPPRMLPIENQEAAIRLLAEHIDVVLVGRQDGAPTPRVEHDRVHDWTRGTAQWRALLPMIREASCVVAPDSSVLHATGAFPDVPLVGLWGPFAATDRAKYYSNHHELNGHSVCPYSPCRAQRAEYPRHKCAAAIGNTGPEDPWCSAMRAITPERIAETVLKLV